MAITYTITGISANMAAFTAQISKAYDAMDATQPAIGEGGTEVIELITDNNPHIQTLKTLYDNLDDFFNGRWVIGQGGQ